MDIPINSNTALVFDLDDTLYNELDFLKSAYIELAKTLEPDAWQPLFANLFSQYRNNQNVFEFVSKTYGIPKNNLIDTYRNHYPNIRPFKGALELLHGIKAKGGKIGIVTDGRSITQRNKLKALGLIEYIDCIVISEELGSEKPNEKNYHFIENELHCAVNYYVGDNFKKDFSTPNKIGWQTVALLDNGLNIHSNAYHYQEQKYLPQHYISSLEEIHLK